MKHPNDEIENLLSQLASRKLANIDLSLARIQRLLTALGNPQDKMPAVVHVAGTNGKGSLVAYLTAICENADYKVNRLTSPFLVKFNEEIYLSGKEINDDYLLSLLKKISAYMDDYPVTFFEATTALAFLAFAENKADITLLETGLGGRLDATNTVASPMLTAITPISIDHSEFLGNTIAAIAGEKAGIIKQNVPCVAGPQPGDATKIIEAAALTLNAPLFRYGKEWNVQKHGHGFFYSGVRSAHFPMPNLAGYHQILNAATAIACVDHLHGFSITDEHITHGITHAAWPARLQRLKEGMLVRMIPEGSELWLDGGHNPGAGVVLADWIKKQHKPVHLICGILENKDAEQLLAPLVPCVASFTAIPITGKHMGYVPEKLAAIAKQLGALGQTAPGAQEAINLIIKEVDKECIILICGSLYLAGDILRQNSSAH